MAAISLSEFYERSVGVIPEGIHQEIGHFNIFKTEEILAKHRSGEPMPYNRRLYYKINLISGRNKAAYADKEIMIEKHALVFTTPKIPYHWLPQDDQQSGYFCVFTPDFMLPSKSGVVLEELPIFQPGGYPVFELTDEQAEELRTLYLKMHREISSDYAYKYDLLRNLVMEVIHYGQKLQPVTSVYSSHNASDRVSSLFIELLERQFPIESARQQLKLKTAKDYADGLAIHVNYLNRILKEQTGKTTTHIIGKRIAQEAKILLKETNWNISEISNCLGFEQVAHFSNFFKKHAGVSPAAFRN